MKIATKDITTIEQYEHIFERYLSICNQAIDKNRDKFPHMEIWNVRWKGLGSDNTHQCAVYDTKPKIIYTLQFTNDMEIKITEKTHATPDDIWPFEFGYLKHVVCNPHEYIMHPVELDWGWLTDVFRKVTAPQAHNSLREGHRRISSIPPLNQFQRGCR